MFLIFAPFVLILWPGSLHPRLPPSLLSSSLSLQCPLRFLRPLICAVTGAIALAISGRTRWQQARSENQTKFWDFRPFSRVVRGLRAFLTLRDYVMMNQLEGQGYSRETARMLIEDVRLDSA